MYETMFKIWVCIAITQIILFIIYLFKIKIKDENFIDTVPIVIYNNMAYWKNGSNLCRTKYNGEKTNLNVYEIIDVLNTDIEPVEIFDILDLLEK